MHDGGCRKPCESNEEEEVPSGVLDLAECLLALRPCSSPCTAESLFSVLYEEAFNPRTLAEHVLGVAKCNKTQTWRKSSVS